MSNKPSLLAIGAMLAIAAIGSKNLDDVSVTVPHFSTKKPRMRTPEDINNRRSKRAAKLARRASRRDR